MTLTSHLAEMSAQSRFFSDTVGEAAPAVAGHVHCVADLILSEVAAGAELAQELVGGRVGKGVQAAVALGAR